MRLCGITGCYLGDVVSEGFTLVRLWHSVLPLCVKLKVDKCNIMFGTYMVVRKTVIQCNSLRI